MALAVFALVAAATYGALGVAGDGFVQLKEARRSLEIEYWLGRQLRLDSSFATATTLPDTAPLRITADNRGDSSFDTLDLLVREAGEPDLTRVHYAVDEESGELRRSTLSLLARENSTPVVWSMGKVKSFDVAVMSSQGEWQQQWDPKPFQWPRALRVRVIDKSGEREWILPLFVGQPPQ
ncbi:MAG: type II secretion system protein GspJ [Mariprofundales bacterium]|nr:type II secretion system protein GspJ [Mariprofundales bacterium]